MKTPLKVDYSDWTEWLKRQADGRSHDPCYEDAIDVSKQLLSMAYQAHRIACRGCGGVGEKVYGDTSTWRSGAGGQSLTEDVCDRCWGTGRSDKTGPNLRKLSCR